MKTSAALKLTKKRLWNGVSNRKGKDTYICVAAMSANVYEIVCPVVMELLYPHETLSTWLLHKKGVSYSYLDASKLQATRHAWINHLIQHYENIGD